MTFTKAEFIRKIKEDYLEDLRNHAKELPDAYVQERETQLLEELEALDLIQAAAVLRMITAEDDIKNELRLFDLLTELSGDTGELYDYIEKAELLYESADDDFNIDYEELKFANSFLKERKKAEEKKRFKEWLNGVFGKTEAHDPDPATIYEDAKRG